ncbi:MAG: radical SAM protein, partial [Phycisphaerales bacterium]|nr:radical SAM protein [Phycisphaerales bacterium]
MSALIGSLAHRSHPLRVVAAQREELQTRSCVAPFEERLTECGLFPLRRTRLRIIQLNLGKMCNQTCRHCHVDAGPDRTEIMTRATMEHCLRAIAMTNAEVVDITGGAPEMNPDFRWLVEQVVALGRRVIDRCNLTILTLRPYQDMVDFLARHRVEITASLPYYVSRQADAQRGDGVFEKSIEALKKLNAAGYGMPDSPLTLNLVYNPVGAFLPPKQAAIEADYRRELRRRFGV